MIPAMGVLAGGEEGVGEFQGVKSYLWVASLRVGGDRRGAGGGSSERRRWRRPDKGWLGRYEPTTRAELGRAVARSRAARVRPAASDNMAAATAP